MLLRTKTRKRVHQAQQRPDKHCTPCKNARPTGNFGRCPTCSSSVVPLEHKATLSVPLMLTASGILLAPRVEVLCLQHAWLRHGRRAQARTPGRSGHRWWGRWRANPRRPRASAPGAAPSPPSMAGAPSSACSTPEPSSPRAHQLRSPKSGQAHAAMLLRILLRRNSSMSNTRSTGA